MQYAAVNNDDGQIESPYFNTKQEVYDWLQANDAEGFNNNYYQIQLFRPQDIINLSEMPEV